MPTKSYVQRLPFVGDWAVLGRFPRGPAHILRASHMATGEPAAIKVTNPSHLRAADRGKEAEFYSMLTEDAHPYILPLFDVVSVSTENEPSPNQSEFNFVAARRRSAAGRRAKTTMSTHAQPASKTPSRSRGGEAGAGAGAADELQCFVMPRGTTDLAALMRGHRAGAPLLQGIAWRYSRQILQAVAYVHGKGVVHNDLKLENIVLRSVRDPATNQFREVAQMMDFGLSSSTVTNPDEEVASFIGTYAYMAPEVLKHRARGTAADMWSFGVALFKMLFGRMPFRSTTLGELVADIDTEAYKEVAKDAIASGSADLNVAVLDLFADMFNTDPAKRSTAAELLTHSDWFGKVGVLDVRPYAAAAAARRLQGNVNGSEDEASDEIEGSQTGAGADDADDFVPDAARAATADDVAAAAARAAAATEAARAAALPPVRLGKECSAIFAEAYDRLATRLNTARRSQSPPFRTFEEAKETVGRLAREQIMRTTKSAGSLVTAQDRLEQTIPLRRAVSATEIARAPWPRELMATVHTERERIQTAIADQKKYLAATKHERKQAQAQDERVALGPRPKAARHTAKRAVLARGKHMQNSPKLHRTKIQTLLTSPAATSASSTALPAVSTVPGRPFH